ncbi:gamma-glutamyltranspeptidase / glutathione hydrolase [Nocardioides terrae]|uniref:Glutathione hydrolase proenzyme n=1 Tax=Nocardioides terrae TaxID=574651 RepID=A0A1I1I2P3_9ACTN|nr:gamma-glutamyltransferase [Nocardioides terrae]SFC30699.1 gamma-glutamyltranspeptidase / glutathione hydrolase [Nocardioides terrae]
MRSRTSAAAFAAALICPALVLTTSPHAGAAAPDATRPKAPPRIATSIGRGGAISTVDPDATRIGLQVLKHGGNAVDAAVAAAAALGLTEPYSSGIGGGGYFVHYNARTHKVGTIDGRETAPRRMRHDSFIDPATGEPYNFTPERVSSGVAVGVPGSLKTWQRALNRWGTRSLARSLKPATRLARRGFVVDQTFHDQTADNQARFAQFASTRRLFLKGGQPPAVGSRFRNRALARTYDLIARKGVDGLYRGRLARQIVHTVQHPPKVAGATLPATPGRMTLRDLRRYRTIDRKPTRIGYRGLRIYGMAPSSSGGSTVGEMLNILEHYNLHGMDAGALYHHYIEASALAFADRNAYVGDPRSVKVPLRQLLSDTFAAERACSINEQTAAPKPVPAGNVASYDGKCAAAPARGAARPDTENVETTNMTVVDRWGNVVEYTLTIEQTGGSGMVVPGRGFLLNNELTDFSAAYDPSDPNRIEPGKRPRSSISPTIVLKGRKPWLALGSPGGATIINTVSQLLVDRIDRGMSIAEAITEPRLANANTTASSAEPAFVAKYAAALAPFGQTLKQLTGPTSAQEIGAATAIQIGRHGRLIAVAEPTRRGGGSARVVRPARR